MRPISPPGGSKTWLELLPPAWAADPQVIVYMVPADTKFLEREATDAQFKGLHCVFAVFERGEEKYNIPLQLNDKDYGNFHQQKKVMESMKGNFHPVKYAGPLSAMPAVCTQSTDFMPVVLSFDKPHKPMLHVREFFANKTKERGING